MVKGSAEEDDCVFRCTLTTKLATSNTSTCLLRIAAAPDISCMMEARSFSYKLVVSTDRGPCCSGNVGMVGDRNRGVRTRIRTGVRTCVSNRVSRVPLTAGRGVNHAISCTTKEGHCVNRLVSLTAHSFGSVEIKLSYTGNDTSDITGDMFSTLKTGACIVGGRPGNIGVGAGYNSARVRILRRCMGRGRLSIKFTCSKSTSEYVTISRGKGIMSKSHVVCMYNGCLVRRKGLGSGAIIAAVVSGLKLCGTYSGVNVGCRRATINSGCICRGVLGGKCILNKRRSKRVVFDGRTHANSNVLASLVIVRTVVRGGRALKALTSRIGVFPRLLGGIHMGSGGATLSGTAIRTTMRGATRRLKASKHVLIHRDKARPIVHIVMRTTSSRVYRGCMSDMIGMVRDRKLYRWVVGGEIIIWSDGEYLIGCDFSQNVFFIRGGGNI